MAIKRKDELEIPGAANRSVKEYEAEDTLREAANARVASANTGENAKSRYSVPSIEGVNTEKFSYESAPGYTSKYQNQIDDLMSGILNRDKFSYDAESDPTYQQYKESYTRNGQRAMQDTVGQVSARTGGLASSYAGAAGQQTYDGYMSALADKIPELRQLAYSMYQDEGNTQRANLEMLMALENNDYGRYQDILGQYNNDRNFNYGVFSDDRNFNYGIYTDDRNYNYQAGRDEIADNRYQDETSYNRDIYQNETTYNKALQKAETLAAAGDFSGFKALGYSDAEIKNMKSAYDRELAAEKLKSSGRSGSGGSGKSTTYKPRLTYNQVMELLEKGETSDSILQDYYYYTGKQYGSGSGGIVQQGLNVVSGGVQAARGIPENALGFSLKGGNLVPNNEGLLSEGEWLKERKRYLQTGTGAEGTDFNSYEEYKNDYFRYLLSQGR